MLKKPDPTTDDMNDRVKNDHHLIQQQNNRGMFLTKKVIDVLNLKVIDVLNLKEVEFAKYVDTEHVLLQAP